MKLTDAQFGMLSTLNTYGPADAVEVVLPPSMDGKRKTKLEWHVGSIATLSKLEALGFVAVMRSEMPTPKNAVGKPGRHRRGLTISITASGRQALETA